MNTNIRYAAVMLLAGFSLNVSAQEVSDSISKTMIESFLEGNNIDSIDSRFKKTEAKYDYRTGGGRTDDIWKHRGTYFNISWVTQTFKADEILKLQDGTNVGTPQWKSSWGAALSWGRQFYICQTKPIGKVLEFAIDYSWIDANLVQYDMPTDISYSGSGAEPAWRTYQKNSYLDPNKLKMLHIDLGMSVGPSITINPFGQLKLAGYYHFTPTWSITLLNEYFRGHFAQMNSIGAAISLNAFSIGWETRWGTGEYKRLFNAFDYGGWNSTKECPIPQKQLDAFGAVISSEETFKFKEKSTRLYIGFRF